MNDLTTQQRRVLAYVRAYMRRQQLPPTRKEISAHFGWASSNAADGHLRALQRKGFLTLLGGAVARGIVLKDGK